MERTRRSGSCRRTRPPGRTSRRSSGGAGSRCFCQRYRLATGKYFAGFPAEERAWRWRQQTGCGFDDTVTGAENISGLVAYVDNEPAGWCAVEPRPAYDGIVRHTRTTQVHAEKLHVGTVATFEAAGLRIVSRPTPRRVVMRIELVP